MAQNWVYCLPEDIENFLGSSGASAFGAHDLRGWETNATECIEQATDEINLHVHRRYSDEGLQASRMLKRWCVVLASCYFCERRGNPIPDSILADAQRIMELLKGVQTGSILLPGVPYRSPSIPAHSNIVIDRRYPRSQQRVVTQNSPNVPISRPRKVEGSWYDI